MLGPDLLSCFLVLMKVITCNLTFLLEHMSVLV